MQVVLLTTTPRTTAAVAQSLRTLTVSAALVTGVALAASGGHFDKSSMLVLGMGSAATGAVAFFRDGGDRITPAGVYFLAHGVFVGLGLILLRLEISQASPSTLSKLGLASFVGLLASMWIYGGRRDIGPLVSSRRWSPGISVSRKAFYVVGGAVAIAGIVGDRITALGSLPSAAAYAGVCLLTTAGVTRPPGGARRRTLFAWLPAGAAVLLYVGLVFSGNGRLVVVGLGLAVLIAINIRRPRSMHKWACLLVVGPALFVAATVQLRDPAAPQMQGSRGISSLYVIDTFGQVVERDSEPGVAGMERQYGATFLKSAIVWVPRSIWPDKPLGLGAELAEVLNPQYRAAGHSDAALLDGEFYVNFGPIGFFLLPCAVAMGLLALGRVQARFLARDALELRGAFQFAAFLAATASLPDLVWGGTFSWAARGGLGALVCLGLAVVAARRSRPDRVTGLA